MLIPVDTLLAWGAAYKKLIAEEIIFKEGTDGHFYYQLVEGSVRWVNITDEGKEFLQNIIEPGESFGELPLFDNKTYAASAIASKDSLILRLHKHTFRQLLREEPEIHFNISRMMAERLRFKFLLLKVLACDDPEHRISTLFTYFKNAGRNVCGLCNQVKLTRQQIADMTGLRVETVIRAIKTLEHKGSVSIDKGKVFC